MLPHTLTSLDEAKPGDHAAFLYRTEAEHRSVMTRFLRDGLERGQKVVYVADAHGPEEILGYFSGTRFEVKPHVQCGQLVILGAEDVYLRDGVFDPHGMLTLIQEEVEQAVARGFTALRVTGEMSWALQEPPGCERLIEYEAKLCEFCEDSRLLALCQYEQNSFSSELLLDVLHTHRLVVLGADACPNFYYFPLAALTGHSLPAARFEIWSKNLLRFKRLLEETREDRSRHVKSEETEALTQLAGSAARDLQNLLAVIVGHSDLLLSDAPPGDPKRVGIDKILQASREAMELANRLAGLGHGRAGVPSTLNLNAVISNAQGELRHVIGEGVEVATILEPTLELVRGDHDQLVKLLANLVANASDSMPRGGELTIATENITLTEEECRNIPESRPGTFVCLSVADTGPCVQEGGEQKAAQSLSAARSGPAGLRLSIVHGIAKQHDGWVNLRSKPGAGSLFRVYFPVPTVEMRAETGKVHHAPRMKGGGCVLVVEDEEIVRRWVTRLLHENGYTSFEAESAEEALDIYRANKEKIHMVFANAILAGRDGVTLARELVSVNPRLGALIGSGDAEQRFRAQSEHESRFPFVSKPYDQVELLTRIREVLASIEDPDDSPSSC
ncbi:MAG: MEDS domain-containing protein [Candidatus Eiseniibacteriota bacterium]|nr:MAG: MEDS domain-containing protein [Candidatus Eisenbacteria bacterium]